MNSYDNQLPTQTRCHVKNAGDDGDVEIYVGIIHAEIFLTFENLSFEAALIHTLQPRALRGGIQCCYISQTSDHAINIYLMVAKQHGGSNSANE